MFVAGIDEAGRGPWAGPVVASAVCLHEGPWEGLADSKALSPRRRAQLRETILQRAWWGIGQASPAEIDALNILKATHLAMLRAVQALRAQMPKHQAQDLVLWVDGNVSPARSLNLSDWPFATHTLVKGDALRPDISAASILAKTHRDDTMALLALEHPGYGFEQHMGYGTPQHQEALVRLGPCTEHRRSFAPVARAARGPEAEGRA